ncbi:CBS domain-containing protein [Streptomyces sp. NPDC005167]
MVQQVREVMTEDPVVVSSLTSVMNVAQLMRRKDMGAVLVVADDRLRGLAADRERLVHRARYRFGPGRHQRCQAKRVHDDLGVTCPLDPGKGWTHATDQDGGERPANGELRPPREQRRISARPGRYRAGPCARTLHRHRRPGPRLPHHRDRLREAIRRTDPAETTKRKWQP